MSEDRVECSCPYGCRGPEDLGRLEHEEDNDTWYECSYDPRSDVHAWMIVPPVDL